MRHVIAYTIILFFVLGFALMNEVNKPVVVPEPGRTVTFTPTDLSDCNVPSDIIGAQQRYEWKTACLDKLYPDRRKIR